LIAFASSVESSTASRRKKRRSGYPDCTQSPSDNRRIAIRAGPTGSITAALAAEWFD
jgi:hypothetical protein